MPTYSIKAPNGKTYSIDGPEGATQAQVVSQILALDPSAGDVPEPVKPEDPVPLAEGVAPVQAKQPDDLTIGNILPTIGKEIVTKFNKSVEKQGGYALSPEINAALLRDNKAVPEFLRPLTNIPSDLAQIASGALTTLNAGTEALVTTLLGDSHDSPGAAIMAGLEAFPEGGMTHGFQFTTPKGDLLSPEKRQVLNEQASKLFNEGASFEDMQKFAKDNGLQPYEGETADALRKSLAERDGASPSKLPEGVTPDSVVQASKNLEGVKEEAANFKASPEPKATDLFPTDESYKADAEEWAKNLEPPSVEKPQETKSNTVAVTEEPTLSRKDANAEFDKATAKPLTTAQFEKELTKQAEEFLNKKKKEEDLPLKEASSTEATSTKTSEEPVVKAGDGKTKIPAPVNDVITRLTNAINSASKIEAKVQRKLYSEERRKRLAEATKLRKTIGGEEGLRASLAALKGELPKADFEGVRDQFSDADIRTLFDHINAKEDGSFSPINAQVGLRKLLDGQLPTASEVKQLDKVFPPSFLKTALKKRSFTSLAVEGASNALNLPRSIMSTFDLSAPFTQGVFMVGRKEFWTSFDDMFKSFGSERAYKAVQDSISSMANYPWMEEANLAISDIHGSLVDREEKFLSNFAEKIPLVGRGVKASERAYTSFLNKLRADTFNTIFEKAKSAGLKPEDDPKFVEDLGKFINNATGRGDLGKANVAAPLLSGILFSPRLMASRVNMLRPDVYVRMHPEVRKEALKSLISFGVITTTALTLAATAGAEVETDPRSSDFGKIKVGNTRYNVLGGFGPYLVLASRMATNERKTIRGQIKEMGGKKSKFDGSGTKFTAGEDFLRSKLSPVSSFVADYMDQKNMVGEPFEVKKEIAERFVPMFLQDANDIIKDQGLTPKSAAMTVPGLFGLNPQTYDIDKPKDSK